MMSNVIHKGVSGLPRLKEQRRARTKVFWKDMVWVLGYRDINS